MYEQKNTPPDQSAGQRQDAIDINDFVFAATGARVRRLTMPDGTHWFPVVDVCNQLGYTTPRKALLDHVPEEHRDILETVTGSHSLSIPAGREWRRDMNLVDLQGLIRLVNGCTKPESQPFKAWVSEVIATIQRDGSYSLEPSPAPLAHPGGSAYVMPQQVADAIMRLEERNLQADEMLAASAGERNELLRRIGEGQDRMVDALRDLTEALRRPRADSRPAAESELTHQQLLATWKARNLIVTDDVHMVAACLAPALVQGGARYRVEEIANRTGLPYERVHDCLRMLIRRGCVRQVGCAPDGAPVYVLP
ncbi:Bro-N domain-containing protein [Streptomyces sp. V4I2]|uniref:BRO-N domain-containing protein n=1 Tax=Streptomyces sp. V4I2 TaxID=3042280 RepID=UPI002787C998|nr:Bro-N domain-containing protein [Streptomyces sp. V4I2]MDQ1047107.1 prophage antirepressor-like protein [Streptomyces sp. V4I2]